jgi:hypothetical protein
MEHYVPNSGCWSKAVSLSMNFSRKCVSIKTVSVAELSSKDQTKIVSVDTLCTRWSAKRERFIVSFLVVLDGKRAVTARTGEGEGSGTHVPRTTSRALSAQLAHQLLSLARHRLYALIVTTTARNAKCVNPIHSPESALATHQHTYACKLHHYVVTMATPPHLSTIPRELRDKIYEHLHREATFFWEVGGSKVHCAKVEIGRAPIPNALLVCHRLREEYLEFRLYRNLTMNIRTYRFGRVNEDNDDGDNTLSYTAHGRWVEGSLTPTMQIASLLCHVGHILLLIQGDLDRGQQYQYGH